MHLKILVPTEIFADVSGVSGIVAETAEGSFGLLEHRLDCGRRSRPVSSPTGRVRVRS